MVPVPARPVRRIGPGSAVGSDGARPGREVRRCPSHSHGSNNDTSAQRGFRCRIRAQAAATRRRVRAGQYPGRVRLTEFWDRMRAQFGDTYAQSVAKDYVFDELGGRTIERALADGEDAKVVWRAVCDTFNVPERLR